MMTTPRPFLLLMGLSAVCAVRAQTVERRTLTLEGAKRIAAAAVDEEGHPIYFQRTHEVQTASADLAVSKARSAAAKAALDAPGKS